MNWKIPLFKVYMSPKEELFPELEKVLYSGFIAEGDSVACLENTFTNYFKKPVVTVNSCTNGIMLSLKLAGVGPGTSVVTVPQTCVATACPITVLGGKIIWCDIDPDTGMMSPDSLKERIEENTKAVIAVYWAGDVPLMEELRTICKRKGVVLIEDAAQALGAYISDNILAGTCSDFGCFSFQAIKQFTTGDGGIIVCDSEENFIKAKSLSWFGIDRKKFRLSTGEIDWNLDIPVAGFKFHMNNISACIGNVQFKNVFSKVIPVHCRNARKIEMLLKDITEIKIPDRNGLSAHWTLSIHCKKRNELMEFLINNGIQASRMHTRIDRYSGLIVNGKYPLPGADKFSETNLCLPCGWWMDDNDIEYLVYKIKEFYLGTK